MYYLWMRVLNVLLLAAVLWSPALEEAAVRFRELQAELELRQLQEDRKNNRKPPPFKLIKVSTR